jgi:solute:Na+ symporter, SSS family
VAAFIFTFSLLFQPSEYIAMFCALTSAMFVGGAGAVIIGGLYWKRGTTAGAWAAMLTGMLASLAGIAIRKVRPEFFLTGQEMTFIAIALAVSAYVLVSLLGPRAVFNLERLLHRGPYAIAGESQEAEERPPTWLEKLGFSREFTGRDRLITYVTLSWPLAWTAIFVVVTAYNLVVDVPADSWLRFWHGWTWFILCCSVVVIVWFTIGGFRDLVHLYRHLRAGRTNPLDDGRVVEDPRDA